MPVQAACLRRRHHASRPAAPISNPGGAHWATRVGRTFVLAQRPLLAHDFIHCRAQNSRAIGETADIRPAPGPSHSWTIGRKCRVKIRVLLKNKAVFVTLLLLT